MKSRKKYLNLVVALVAVLSVMYLTAARYVSLDVYKLLMSSGGTVIWEGSTVNDYETTFTVADPSADRTITFPDSTGTVALNPYGASIDFEGATADAYETTLTVTDPTADRTVTIPNETAAVMVSALTTNATDAANSVTGASNALKFEGATADAYETSVTLIDPTADRTVTIPNETGAVMMSSLATNGTDVANSVTGGTNVLVFEGATADAFETSIIPVDPTVDRTITLPNETGAVMMSSLATNGTDVVNSVTGGTNALVFEGATANDHETSLTLVDPTADRTVTIPNETGAVMMSSLATNGTDVANSVTGTTNGLIFEGATANAYETTVQPTDPTADRTITIPDKSVTLESTIKVVTADSDGKTMTIAEAGDVQSCGGAGVWALPEASTCIGCVFHFAVTAAANVDINPADADLILGLTNAAGDAMRCAAVGGTVTLVVLDATNIAAYGQYCPGGNWTDVN